MSEPRIDPEQLAALLDGRLDERQRAEVMAQLAKSPDALEAYADAVAIAAELEGGAAGGGGAEVIPLRQPGRPRGFRVARWQWLAAAAVIAGVALTPLVWRSPSDADASDPGRFVDALANENAGLPPGWNGRPWSATRSVTDPLTPEARAVRVGVGLVDLELAVRARDTAAAQFAAEIAALLDGIPASGPVIAVYREVGRRSGQSPMELKPLLARGGASAIRLAGENAAELGALFEAARVASSRRDTEFFRSSSTRQALQRIRERDDLDPRVRSVIARIGAVGAPPSGSEWERLTVDLDGILRVLGS